MEAALFPPNELEACEATGFFRKKPFSPFLQHRYLLRSQVMRTPSNIDHVLSDHNYAIISLRVNLHFYIVEM